MGSSLLPLEEQSPEVGSLSCSCRGGCGNGQHRRTRSRRASCQHLTWNQQPLRFLSREVAGESCVPGSCLNRQEPTLSFLTPIGYAESPQVGYLISFCCCLFSCRMINGVKKKKGGGFSEYRSNPCSLCKNSNNVGVYSAEIGKST